MSTRGTIESIIRDKLGVTLVILYLVWEAMQDISTVNALISLGILAILAGYTLYENHRHVEKMGNVNKSKDLILEFKDHLNKELSRFDEKPMTSEQLFLDLTKWAMAQRAKEEEAEPESEVARVKEPEGI